MMRVLRVKGVPARARWTFLRWLLLLLVVVFFQHHPPVQVEAKQPPRSRSRSRSRSARHHADVPSLKSTREQLQQQQRIVKKELSSALQKKKNDAAAAAAAPGISVEALLLPRRFPLKGVIRLVCAVAMGISLLQCLATAGIPHIQAIWSLLYSSDMMDGTRNDSTMTKRLSMMPFDYRPSVADIHLSRLISCSTNELLPPISLPSAGPLLRLFCSVLIYVGSTLLLPRWFTAAKVFLEYQKLPMSSVNRRRRRRPEQQRLLVQKNAAVLVQVDKQTPQQLLICPLQWSSSSSSFSSTNEEDEDNEDSSSISDAVNNETATVVDDDSSSSSHDYFSHLSPTFFDLHQYCGRVYLDLETGRCQEGGPRLHSAPWQDLWQLMVQQVGGISSASTLQDSTRQTMMTMAAAAAAQERYGPYNRPTFETPTIRDAFVTRISSPLVVVQVVGRLLSCVEEGVSAMVNLVLTGFQHWYDARQVIGAARQMQQEVQTNVQDTSTLPVWILRRTTATTATATPKKKKKTKGTSSLPSSRQWMAMTAGDLIPGDVFVMLAKNNENVAGGGGGGGAGVVMPVDALLLEGQSLVNEAVLTGESVPQSKTPVDFAERLKEEEDDDDDNAQCCLDMDADRNSILFAGTTLIYCSSSSSSGQQQQQQVNTTQTTTATTTIQGVSVPAHNQTSGVVCLALRTGTYSSKGQLLRTLRSGTQVGAISNPQSEKDALRLIMSLSVFAMISCASLFLPRAAGAGQAARRPVSTFRRIVQCTRILIASIPSDLPLALSAVARSCSYKLRQDSEVICSEPGSLLTAAYVDTVVFDKTGTLTADTQSVSKLIPKLPNQVAEVSEAFQLSQLAGCHSLIHLKASSASGGEKRQIVGDPLDEAALQYSGWTYNDTAQCYVAPIQNTTAAADDTPILPSQSFSCPVRLWQIKSFPFDPQKRMSTAVVVLENADGSLRLLSFTKGSPDTVRDMYHQREDPNFVGVYEKQRKEFEVQGYRSIAMGWKDLSGTELMTKLFPNGIEKDEMDGARQQGSTLHRSDFEKENLEFGGFVRFDASIRPSSRRIIEELNDGGIRSIMLTGDSIDASCTVATKVRLIRERQVAILEVVEGSSENRSLQWRFIKFHKGKVGQPGSQGSSFETAPFSASSLKDVLKREKLGKCAIATTGVALERMFENVASDPQMKRFVDNLSRVSVIARATPKQKNDVILHLKHQGGHTVMMCGDGVNDVTAMKSADVAVALLNGFGDEKDLIDGKDFDDERRRKKVEAKLLGSQRLTHGQVTKVKRKEARDSFNMKLQKAQAKIRERAAARSGTDSDDSNNVAFDLQDAKEMVSATLAVVREERTREKSLKCGGGDAARLLAEERRKSSAGDDDDGGDETETVPAIKPGEASLVAPFSCLHPSIEGVDSVLRAGVATAACALATQELIALNSLMSCFGLATLYRDGFRYGKHMSMVEMMLYVLVDQQRYAASCTPRPRLPKAQYLRPPRSMFQPSAILRTLGQAGVNLVTMSIGVRYARRLEGASSIGGASKYHLQIEGSNPPKISKMLSALVASSSTGEASKKEKDEDDDDDDDDAAGTASLFRRPPFCPNYETNMVFILSILQNMLVSLASHKGKPFYRAILEDRPLTTLSVATLGLCVALIAETAPKLNTLLQLKAMPTKKSQAVFFGIVLLNIVASNLVNRIFSKTDSTIITTEEEKAKTSNVEDCNDLLAADLEERLLEEESSQNLRSAVIALALLTYLAIEALVKS